MPSQFDWVDFAEADRQRMLKVIQLFREQDTRDELGIGTIRDAFADYFFPGTSTIQTRVRYMLFIPWLYREVERKQADADRVRDAEIKLIYALLDTEGQNQGVIGQDAKDKLKRLPSSVYWAGLGTWGIRRFQGSQDQYHRYLQVFPHRQQQRLLFKAEVDQELGLTIGSDNWDPGLPKPPAQFPNKASLALRRQEAQYLQERICLLHRHSLLAYLVTEPEWVEADFFWEHPVLHRVPADLEKDVTHAQNFSETMHGAALLYNLLLARQSQQQDLVDEYQTRWREWADRLAARWPALLAWQRHLPVFWSSSALALARIPPLTRAFVETWLNLVFSNNSLAQLADNPTAHQLIQNRETQLKRQRARLDNPRALERWPGHSGDQQLEYRWRVASTFTAEILTGLRAKE